MALLDYRPETAEIKFKNGSFRVRGLSLEDVSTLIRTHLPDMEMLFDLYQGSTTDVFAKGNADRFILTLAKDAPALVANFISLASGEEGSADAARSLSLPLQVTALSEIGRLTFEDAGGPKNFFAALMNLLGGVVPKGVMAKVARVKAPTRKVK